MADLCGISTFNFDRLNFFVVFLEWVLKSNDLQYGKTEYYRISPRVVEMCPKFIFILSCIFQSLYRVPQLIFYCVNNVEVLLTLIKKRLNSYKESVQ